MRIVIVHNRYRQRGGEDAVVQAEAALLARHGHAVELFLRDNQAIDSMPRATVALHTLWSVPSARAFEQLLRDFRPDVVHVHNTLALVSPSVYWVARRCGVPVVQTLHNFRLLCPQAMFLRQGRICEDCLGKLPWRGAARGCYRDSRLQSSVLAGTLALHQAIGTWSTKVTRYIALNEFCRDKFIAGGLPAARIAIKPHFVDAAAPPDNARRGILFAGRLAPEKGIDVLARAAALLPGMALSVAGQGPLGDALRGLHNVTLLGQLEPAAVTARMQAAAALVVPSICHETFGMVVVESYASGTPVIASRIGALAALVAEGETGLLFDAGNSQDLARVLQWALAHPDRMAAMGRRARTVHEAEYTAERNHQQLMQIYQDAISACTPKAMQ